MVEEIDKPIEGARARKRSERSISTISQKLPSRERICHFLSIQTEPVTPAIIASSLEIPPSTVRARLSELRREGLVQREYHGAYVERSKVRGWREEEPRLQNLQVKTALTVRAEHKGTRPKGFTISIEKDDLSILIQFGHKNQRVNYYVKAPRGLDLYGFRLAHLLVKQTLNHLGYASEEWDNDEEWMVIRYEPLWDYGSVLLEGVKSMTWKSLDGTLEKYYNKESGMRRELHLTRPISVQQLDVVIQGGITTGILMQTQYYQTEQLNKMIESLGGMDRAVQALADAVFRLVDREGN